MNVKLSISGFKGFKKNSSEILNKSDILSLLCAALSLFIYFILFFANVSKSIRRFFAVLSLIFSLPAIIKCLVAFISDLLSFKENESV